MTPQLTFFYCILTNTMVSFSYFALAKYTLRCVIILFQPYISTKKMGFSYPFYNINFSLFYLLNYLLTIQYTLLTYKDSFDIYTFHLLALNHYHYNYLKFLFQNVNQHYI